MSTSSHEREEARSYYNLAQARQAASKKSGYNSDETRQKLHRIFEERFGSPPHSWQLDVSEATILGLDGILIAGTGAGKTMPFAMPLMLDTKKQAVMISPLKVLQGDQASRFQKMQVPAVAVNGDTWDSTMRAELEGKRYQGIFASPEMCLKHAEFRSVLTSSFNDIGSVIVDEAHCIAQWGGDFRTAYSELAKLRAFFPPHIPFLAVSATMTPATLREVRASLGIEASSSFFLNLGNDRPNIAYAVHKIDSAEDYESLKPHIFRHAAPSDDDDLIKSIVFTNSVSSTQSLTRAIRSWLPRHLWGHVEYLHAHRTPRAKNRIMKRFRRDKFMILVATEAAGMGADIPDIEQVIQFGVPPSLTIWVQRAGRAGRSSGINARALLLVEKSMFERQKRKRKKPDGTNDIEAEESDNDNEPCGTNEVNARAAESKDDDAIYEWKKKVEGALREWIETEECRRDVVDRHFDNPPSRQPPTHLCCDNCSLDVNTTMTNTRPTTPPPLPDDGYSTVHTTPSKSADENGKRKMTQKQPASRRSEHLEHARQALETWRFKTVRNRYTPGPFTTAAFMPDAVVKALASATSPQNTAEMKAVTSWIFTDRHGDEVLAVLRDLDHRERRQHEEAKLARAAARKAVTKARQDERKRLEAIVREERQEEREREKAWRAAEAAAEKAEKEKAKAEAAARRAEAKAAVKPAAKKPRRPPLQGTSILNLTPNALLTPSQNCTFTPASTPSTSLTDLRQNIFMIPSLLSPTSLSRPRPRPRPIARPVVPVPTQAPCSPLSLPSPALLPQPPRPRPRPIASPLTPVPMPCDENFPAPPPTPLIRPHPRIILRLPMLPPLSGAAQSHDNTDPSLTYTAPPHPRLVLRLPPPS